MFYHGTTDALHLEGALMPPLCTGIQRESWRTRYLECVFFTNSMKSARSYAKKAASKYGGEPIVYVVEPVGEYSELSNTEYISAKAKIVGIM